MTRPALLCCAALALGACATAGEKPAARPSSAAAASSTPVPLPPPPVAAAGPSARGERLFAEAAAASEEGRKPGAAPDWAALERRWRAAAEDGGLAESWYNLGVCQERLGKRAEAGASFQRALELQPAFREAAANQVLLSEPTEPAPALAAWSELLRRHPDDALARARLAAWYEQSGQLEEAWRLSREALLRDPRSSGALKVMMRVALARGNGDLAHLLAVRAARLDPNDPEIPTAIGRILAKQGDEAAAVVQWRKAVALQEDYAPARAELLHQELSRQHWSGVAEQARALLQSDPGDARSQLALGVALRQLGETEKAAAAYDQADRLAGGRLPEVHLARAVLLARVQERCEPALDELRRYAAAAGPAGMADGNAGRLERECVQVLAASRAAEEEARRMKAEAARSPPAPGPASDTGTQRPTP